MLLRGEHWTAFVPFAARWPIEVHLLPHLDESGALSAEHVLNVLARLNASPLPESVETDLPLDEAPVANTGRYDSLRSTDAVMTDAEENHHA